ncbi:MAG: methylenetetrahydrofolate reductase C-terminal domain-containing protein, partial [Methanosarcina sp.]|nr:methylenetetrahydrofolate reductase C-terminal domain-containing protein [Methanosarcina sp.]
EVNKENDCVWTLIYNRLKKIKKLDLLYTIHAPQEHCLKIKRVEVPIS